MQQLYQIKVTAWSTLNRTLGKGTQKNGFEGSKHDILLVRDMTNILKSHIAFISQKFVPNVKVVKSIPEDSKTKALEYLHAFIAMCAGKDERNQQQNPPSNTHDAETSTVEVSNGNAHDSHSKSGRNEPNRNYTDAAASNPSVEELVVEEPSNMFRSTNHQRPVARRPPGGRQIQLSETNQTK
jgi:hypothetical protein